MSITTFFSDAAQEEMMTMPGSRGEHDLQERYGNQKRAEGFYRNQMLNYLNPQMRAFIARQEMFFLSTADGLGECDVSFRAGDAGFVHAIIGVQNGDNPGGVYFAHAVLPDKVFNVVFIGAKLDQLAVE